MGVPFPMQEAYLGFMRDTARHQLPGGSLWDLIDWLPQQDASARERFGWTDVGSQSFATIHVGAAAYGTVAFYAPFSGGAEIVAQDGNGGLFKYVPSTGVGTYLGALTAYSRKPVFHRNQVILSQGLGATLAHYAGGGAAPAAIAGSPQADSLTLYGDYTVACNVSGNPQRAYFSAPGDPLTWDLTNSFQDVPGPIIGCRGIRNALLLWTADTIWRVRGNTPPQANLVGNLVTDHLWDTGLLDSRSIDTYGEEVLFANAEGVWLTNGATVDNMCVVGGIATYWQSLLKNYTTSWVIAGGVIRGKYVVSIIDNANNGNIIDCLMLDLASKRWSRLGNVPAVMFAHATSALSEELYFVNAKRGFVSKLGSIWNGSSITDADGTAILPSLETPFFRGFQRLHRKWIQTDATSVWKYLYLNAEAPGSGNALRVAYTTDPAVGGAYTTIGDIPAVTGLKRTRLPINPNGGAVPARGLGFKIYQVAGMVPTDLRLSDLELEFFTREGSR